MCFPLNQVCFGQEAFVPNRRIGSLCRVCRRRRRCGLVVKIGWTDPRSSVVQAMRAALQSDTFDHWINWSLHNLLRRTDAPQEARARGKQREQKVGNQPPIRRRSAPPATPGPSPHLLRDFVQRFCRFWNLKTRARSLLKNSTHSFCGVANALTSLRLHHRSLRICSVCAPRHCVRRAHKLNRRSFTIDS